MEQPLKSLSPPRHHLRPIDMNGLDMTLLHDSIVRNGLLVPVTICNNQIVDGYRRYLVYKALGNETIPAHSVDGDPDTLRIIAQTRHTEFGRDDKRALIGNLLSADPSLTAARLAHTLQWSPVEVESLAGVDGLIPAFQELYENGTISIAEVWHVSRCRDGSQETLLGVHDEPLLDRAQALHRECRGARRRRLVSRPRGRSLTQVQLERDNPRAVGPVLIKAKAQSAVDGWNACLTWVLGEAN